MTTPEFPGQRPEIWTVPYERNIGRFVGRQQLLADLERRLATEGMAVRQVVAGLWGVGKTQLTLEYAYRFRSRYRAVLWVTASTQSTLVRDYSALERDLGLPGVDRPDQRLVLAAVRAWFETHDRWLLVFDDAGPPDEIIGEGPEFERLQDFLPRPLRGHVIVTTRDQTWESTADVLQMAVLRPEEAERFLLDQTGSSDADAAKNLAEALSFLPLALEQARAYITASSISLLKYLDRLRRFPELFERGRPRDHEGTVASTSRVSIETVRLKCQGAAELLEVCAFLFREDIPLLRDDVPNGELFEEGVPGLTPGLVEITRNALAFDAAIIELRRYSLVHQAKDLRGDSAALSMHELVQTLVRLSMSYDDQMSRAAIAVRLMERLFPVDVNDTSTWSSCDRLVAHAVACVRHADDRRVEPVLAAGLFYRVLTYLLVRARYVEAHGHAELLMKVVDAAHGAGGREYVRASMICGEVSYELGDLRAAEAVLDRAVEIADGIAALDARTRVRLLSSFSLVLVDLGEIPKAMDVQSRAVAIAEAAQEMGQVELARTISNLGVVHYEAGRRLDARKCQERASALLEGEAPGSDSHMVARRLAVVLYDLGFFEEALTGLEDAVGYFDARLGEDHPDVAKTLHHLGFVYWDLGRLSRARECFEHAEAIFRRVYRRPHPAVARTLAGLGMVLMDQGGLEEALAKQQEALKIFEDLFGPDHFEVGRTLDKVGFVLRNLQRRVQAREQQERAVQILSACFRPAHPEVAIPLSNLALVLQELGDLESSIARHRQALAIFEVHFLSDHPHRQVAYARYAVALQRDGQLEEARSLLEAAIPVIEQKKGATHPDVARTKEKLAFVLDELGEIDAARELFRQGLAILTESLGQDHPRTAISEQRVRAFGERYP